jgi:hypothetical protein
MNQPVYQSTYSTKEERYIFESIGTKGKILKVVKFFEIDENLYNLGFGDFDPITNQIDDKVVSDNGDLIKVMATVIGLALKFLDDNPMAMVFFEGSTPQRTQFYQWIINRYYDDMVEIIEIYGVSNGESEPFQKTKVYESFLIQKLF